MADTITYILAFCFAMLMPLIYFQRYRSQRSRAQDEMAAAQEAGLTEPVSLHPSININSCIFTGACLRACPEGDILGLAGGRVQLVSPTKCIGHGACMTACPTEAITLVFGTERRGVEIPHVKETFETNVEGIYIAGELGGMGLIRNAVTQGREAMEYISQSLNGNRNSAVYDVAIIGAGPAGLAASLQARKLGLSFVTVDQEATAGGTILSYPRQKLVMTQPMNIPLFGKFQKREVFKEELLELFVSIAQKNELTIRGQCKIDSIVRTNNHFTITGSGATFEARRVLLAIGRRGTPRKLGVAGEHSTKVAYRLLEPEQYSRQHLLVVGGGDSAVEAAITLGEQEGTTVSISYRKPVFSRIKESNRARLHRAIDAGWVKPYLESQVTEIAEKHVVLSQRGASITLPNDYVFVLIGGELPTKFLNSIGIKMEIKHGER